MKLSIKMADKTKYILSVPDDKYLNDFVRNINTAFERKQFVQLQAIHLISHDEECYINAQYISSYEIDKLATPTKEQIQAIQAEELRLSTFSMNAVRQELTAEETEAITLARQPMKTIFDAAQKKADALNAKALKQGR